MEVVATPLSKKLLTEIKSWPADARTIRQGDPRQLAKSLGPSF